MLRGAENQTIARLLAKSTVTAKLESSSSVFGLPVYKVARTVGIGASFEGVCRCFEEGAYLEGFAAFKKSGGGEFAPVKVKFLMQSDEAILYNEDDCSISVYSTSDASKRSYLEFVSCTPVGWLEVADRVHLSRPLNRFAEKEVITLEKKEGQYETFAIQLTSGSTLKLAVDSKTALPAKLTIDPSDKSTNPYSVEYKWRFRNGFPLLLEQTAVSERGVETNRIRIEPANEKDVPLIRSKKDFFRSLPNGLVIRSEVAAGGLEVSGYHSNSDSPKQDYEFRLAARAASRKR
jgi:hypothetical protein